MTSVRRPRTIHVEHCMGTVFTIDIRDPGNWNQAVEAVVSWLHHVDAVFSTYRPGSDISRIQRGELVPADADPDVPIVLELGLQAQGITHGSFTAMPHGRIDPTGLVKGWAIERASRILTGYGTDNHAVNGGGDMQLAGEAEPGRPWIVGITDPRDRQRVCTVVSGRDIAVATSGTAERGAHIVDPMTHRPAQALVSATVVGPSSTWADVYATAAFVMGRHAISWIDTLDYSAYLVAASGEIWSSRRWNSMTH